MKLYPLSNYLTVTVAISCRYFSASIFCKVGISGFVGGVLLGVAMFSAQLSLLFIAERVRIPLLLYTVYMYRLRLGACIAGEVEQSGSLDIIQNL